MLPPSFSAPSFKDKTSCTCFTFLKNYHIIKDSFIQKGQTYMKIVIIDGQGGKIGALLIDKIKHSSILSSITPPIELVAIGTNSIATSSMLKAGANLGATGENPVVVNCRNADIIAGPIGILAADSLLGEVTPQMAAAVGQSPGLKILLPINKCNNYIVGIEDISLQDFITKAVLRIEEFCTKELSQHVCPY